MDGVIVDSERYWAEYEEERIFPAAGVADVPAAAITGLNYREAYDRLDSEYGVDIEREAFLDIYRECAHELYTERVELLDGFRDLCGTLRDRGVALGVVSSSPQDWIELVCDRFELTGFDAVVSAEDIDDPGKPEPHVYRHAAAEAEIEPENCTAVEDSTHGIEAATGAGMRCIGYRAIEGKDLDVSGADVVVSGPQELRAELLAEGRTRGV